MAQEKRLIITFADDISEDMRRTLVAALGVLEIAPVQHDETDETDPAMIVPLFIGSPGTQHASSADHPDAIRVLLAEHGYPREGNWLAIAPDDIGKPSPGWLAMLRTLGDKLGRRGLARYAEAADDFTKLWAWSKEFGTDPLAALIIESDSPEQLRKRIAALNEDLAETQRTALERDKARKLAEHEAQLARKKAVAAQNEMKRMRLQVEALKLHLEESSWSPETLQGETRKLVESARQAVWRARAAAAAGEQAEADGVDARSWADSNTRYHGHTKDARPHGVGVMRFGSDADDPFYRGEFVDGRRHGYGIGADAGGRVWIGEWKHDQPDGMGALEFQDGRRWEGKVKPPNDDGPAYHHLHVWQEPDGKRLQQVVHTEARLQLEGPPAPAPS